MFHGLLSSSGAFGVSVCSSIGISVHTCAMNMSVGFIRDFEKGREDL